MSVAIDSVQQSRVVRLHAGGSPELGSIGLIKLKRYLYEKKPVPGSREPGTTDHVGQGPVPVTCDRRRYG